VNDEKSAVQALDGPSSLPMKPGRRRRDPRLQAQREKKRVRQATTPLIPHFPPASRKHPPIFPYFFPILDFYPSPLRNGTTDPPFPSATLPPHNN